MPEPKPVGGDERHLRHREEHRGAEAGDGDPNGPERHHAAASRAGGFRSVTSTSITRVRSTFSTVRETSDVSIRSALRGTRPKRPSTHPPTVSYVWGETASPVISSRSSMGSFPATR